MERETYRELFNKKDYEKVIKNAYNKFEYYFSNKDKQVPEYKNAQEMVELLCIIEYSILSSFYAEYYNDCVELSRLYYKIFPIDFLRNQSNYLCTLEAYWVSFVFITIRDKKKYFKDEDLFLIHEIKNKESGLIKDYLSLYSNYIDNIAVYIVYSFNLPYALPISDGVYETTQINNISHFKIVSKHYSNVTSIHGFRMFTQIEIYSENIVSTDRFWNGYTVHQKSKYPYNENFIITAVNEIVSYLSMVSETKYVSYVNSKQIGNITSYILLKSGKKIKGCIDLSFKGLALANVANQKSITINEVEEKAFKKLLSYDLSLIIGDKLFAQAKMCINQGQYTEAFYFMNSSCEAYIYEFTRLVSNDNKEYNDFKAEKSKCDTCPNLGKEFNHKIEHHAPKLPPSIFNYPKFLKEIGALNNKENKTLKKLIYNIRNNKLRNKLMHGGIHKIDGEVVELSFENLNELKEFLYNKLSEVYNET